MEDEIGEYGRTNTGKIIGKFAFLEYMKGERDKNKVILIKNNKVTNDLYYFENNEYIVKHSPNIIDLIEEGDYVNGERVDSIEKDEEGHTYYMQNYELPAFDLKKIETIVTKEQFEFISYKVTKM